MSAELVQRVVNVKQVLHDHNGAFNSDAAQSNKCVWSGSDKRVWSGRLIRPSGCTG